MATTIRQALANFITRAGVSPENPSTPLSAMAKWLSAGNQTVSGEQINEIIALQITTVMNCVRVLAESVASLPCNVYEQTSLGKQLADQTRLHQVLTQEPNDEMSAFTFWETIVGSNALTGNAYAEIKWMADGQNVGELYPLNPLITEPWRKNNGDLIYRTKQGKLPGVEWRYIEQENILHFKLFSLEGIRGLSPVQQARQSLGLTRAVEKFGARFFGNGSRPGGVLSYEDDEELDEKEYNQAKNSWEAAQGGSNQGRTAVLSGKWKYQQIGLSPEDSQFLATRAFQRSEIAAMFRVPAHMVGDTSKISNSSYEQMNMSFVNDTLRPILIRIEAELNRKLTHKVGRKAGKFFTMFDLSQRLRADHETTAKGIALGRQWGLMTVNEGRVSLGLNPLADADGDSRLVPVNMMNSELIPTQTEVPNGATPGAGGDDDDNEDDTDTTKPGKNKTTPPDEVDDDAEPEA